MQQPDPQELEPRHTAGDPRPYDAQLAESAILSVPGSGVFGVTNMGKSNFVKGLLRRALAEGWPIIVNDMKDEYSQKGRVRPSVQLGPLAYRWSADQLAQRPRILEHGPLQLAIVPNGPTPRDWGRAFNLVAKLTREAKRQQLLWVVEEVQFFERYERDWIEAVATQWRDFGVTLVLVSQRAGGIEINARSQLQNFVCFAQSEPPDLEALRLRTAMTDPTYADRVARLAPGEFQLWRAGVVNEHGQETQRRRLGVGEDETDDHRSGVGTDPDSGGKDSGRGAGNVDVQAGAAGGAQAEERVAPPAAPGPAGHTGPAARAARAGHTARVDAKPAAPATNPRTKSRRRFKNKPTRSLLGIPNMEGFQTEPFPLVTGGVWTAGADFPVTFQNLPDLLGDAIAHVMSIDITLKLTPTYTTAPTNVGHNAAVRQMTLFDGSRDWLQQMGWNALRAFERGENGRLLIPDTLTNGGSTNPRYVKRRFTFGPNRNKFTDGLMPCSQLNQGGNMTLTAGALTDISTDCTACTGTYDITANLVGLHSLRLPPWYQRIMLPLTSGTPISQRALYALIMALNSSSFDAFAANDLGSISLDGVAGGVLMKPVRSTQLNMTYQADNGAGGLDVPMGDPDNATYDVAARQVNVASPTAIAAQALDLQMIQWPQRDARITKLPANVPSALTVSVSGANAATQLLFGRYLPFTAPMAAEMANRCFQKLPGKNWGAVGLRLGSKKSSYAGTRQDYLPKQVLIQMRAAA